MSLLAQSYSPPGPVAQAFIEEDWIPFRILRGPLGGGKTVAAIAALLRYGALQAPGPDGVRRSRWLWIRNSLPMLRNTSLKSWQSWVNPNAGKLTLASPIVQHIKAGDLDLEVIFLGLSEEADVVRVLGAEATGAIVDEVREVPKAIWDALTARVGRYPRVADGGPSWSGILAMTNSYDETHWLAELERNPPQGMKFYVQPSGLSSEAENRANLLPDYYERLTAGKSQDWVGVYVRNQIGFTREGKPVFPEFDEKLHVGDLRPAPELPLFIANDWGLSAAGIAFQVFPDSRVRVLSELVQTDMGALRFADAMKAHVANRYPGLRVAKAYGDPAGSARSQTDERTPFEIARAQVTWPWVPAPTNDLDLRLEGGRLLLSRLVNAQPMVMIDRSCIKLRKALANGYVFEEQANNAGEHKPTPKKNQHSHVADAFTYMAVSCGAADLVVGKVQRKPGGSSGSAPRIAHGTDYNPLDPSDRGSPERGGGHTVVGGGIGIAIPNHILRMRERRNG